MRVAHGTVVSGQAVHLVADTLAELEAGLSEADRGETISGEELLEQLRRHG